MKLNNDKPFVVAQVINKIYELTFASLYFTRLL